MDHDSFCVCRAHIAPRVNRSEASIEGMGVALTEASLPYAHAFAFIANRAPTLARE